MWNPRIAGNPEVDWVKKNKPDWEHIGTDSSNHPQYEWVDGDNIVHRVQGYYSGGSKKSPIENITRNLRREMGKCEGGRCNHADLGAPQQEITEEPNNPFVPYRPGQQVNYQGEPHFVGRSEFMDGQHYYELSHAITGAPQTAAHDELQPLTTGGETTAKTANILDPVHPTLPESVWDQPESPEPVLKPQHAHFITKHIYDALEGAGYANPHEWLHLVLTGSLTTFQYSNESDVDISLFVNSDAFPDWSRAEIIGVMIEHCDGTPLAGTPYPLQCFVVGGGIKPHDLYKRGLRSGYDIDKHHWIEPPDPSREHDVKIQENGFYVYALESADKMERLLRYEPDKAVDYWHQIHSRRRRDQMAGKGDFSEANIVYKFLANRGLFPRLSEASGEYIAHVQEHGDEFGTQGQSHLTAVDPTNVHEPDHRFPQRISNPNQTVVAPAVHYPPITQAEARGNSRPVSHDEFQQLAGEGHQRYNEMAANTAPTTGLDAHWQQIKDKAYGEVLKPWGGVTVNAQTGIPLESDADRYALTAREPGMQSVSVPENPTRDEFHAAMDNAKLRYQHLLEREGHHLGAFHDDDEKRIDIDPTLVVHSPHEVETIGAYTRALGGAYHFRSGDGYWPPHVAEPSASPEEAPSEPVGVFQ